MGLEDTFEQTAEPPLQNGSPTTADESGAVAVVMEPYADPAAAAGLSFWHVRNSEKFRGRAPRASSPRSVQGGESKGTGASRRAWDSVPLLLEALSQIASLC